MQPPKTMAQGVPKLDSKTFWQIQDPGPEEKLVLQLASQFQRDEDPTANSTSWANQLRAVETVNRLGFIKALELLRMEEL
jgi:hypothetical protein